MTSILIVDDDRYIREGLKKLVDWTSIEISELLEAEGGYEAMEKIERHAPSIVLTDIRMPKGSGLELIEQIRSRGLETLIIVLSGYDEYEYIRQAMKFQVEDYLLKPVDATELTAILANCTERLQDRWIQNQMQRESFLLLKNNILLRWAQDRIQHDQLREKLKFLNLSLLQYEKYQICLISWRSMHEDRLSPAEEQFRSFAIWNSMEEAVAETGRGICFINETRLIIVLFVGNDNDPEVFRAQNLAWMNDLAPRYAAILKTSWINNWGDVVDMPSRIHESYNNALTAWTNHQTDAVNASIAIVSRNPIIRQVERYVQENYGNELSLQLLSDRFDVNNVYLGRLFKEETDEYFNDYLNRVRLDHAKRLLLDTTLKASVIANQVGFLDSNYFFRKFKMKYGLSPTDYRAQVANTENKLM
ncbi:response regulator transcription factor [Cohnella terricola]|uniref:Response regulator n=1 Tax=Cohnella terricola TaxID=1289167 RepID=A0A559JWR0_9BACL|nr:response regulator [Cohnella terricola]TVY04267.1 response regulator [Cohnella terricola]